MALNLDTILADFNGTALATAGAGEWGFIPDEYKLAFPNGFNPPNAFVLGTSPFANPAERRNFMKANYQVLHAGGVPDAIAMQIIVYRMHLADRGILTTDLQNRCVIEDEYVYVHNQGANWDDPANDLPAAAYQANIAKHYKRYGNTYVHMMSYMFLSRGHHYRQDYHDIYERLKTACFIPTNPGFALLSNEQIFRLAIHCFGVRPLIAMSMADHAATLMAAAMYIRFSPHPPISGVAHITTLSAVTTAMHKEPWWGAFHQKFQGEIAAIDAEVLAIQANPYSYHVSSRFVGGGNRVMPSVLAMAAFNRLCQFALGYIDHLGKKHSLYGQQAITKKSGGLTGLGDAFSRACDRFGKPDHNVLDMATFLNPL